MPFSQDASNLQLGDFLLVTLHLLCHPRTTCWQPIKTWDGVLLSHFVRDWIGQYKNKNWILFLGTFILFIIIFVGLICDCFISPSFCSTSSWCFGDVHSLISLSHLHDIHLWFLVDQVHYSIPSRYYFLKSSWFCCIFVSWAKTRMFGSTPAQTYIDGVLSKGYPTLTIFFRTMWNASKNDIDK